MFLPFQVDLLLIRSLMVSPLNFRNILDVQQIISSSNLAPSQQTCPPPPQQAFELCPQLSEMSCINRGFVCVLRKGE